MSKLSAFLHPVEADREEEILISKRFLDEAGNPAPFKIRALRQKDMDAITTLMQKKSGGKANIDGAELNRRIVVAGTVEPAFAAKEMLDAYGAGADPTLVPGNMLTTGEYMRLLRAILHISDMDEESIRSLEEEAKN